MNLFELFVKIGVDDQASGKLSKLSSSLGKGLATAAKIGTAAVGAASTAIVALGKIGLDYNKQMETYTTNFEVMMGDAEAAAKKVEELKEMGARTPFELGDLASATQTLLAFNVSADDSTGVLQKLGDISLGNTQKLESLTRAYGKMNASQKVTLEDINMMIDAGFNPLLIVAEETGKTMTEVYDDISKGKVSFEQIEDAITKATSAGGQFYQGMAKASQTTEGLISTLKDNATALVGEVYQPISEGLVSTVLPAAIDAIGKLSEAFKTDGVEGMIAAAGEMLGGVINAIVEYTPKVADVAVSLIESLIQGLRGNKASIAEGAAQIITTLTTGILELLPDILALGIDLIASLASGIAQAITGDGFLQSVVDVILQLVNTLTNPDQLSKLTDAALALVTELAFGLVNAIPQLLEAAMQIIINLVEFWLNPQNLGQMVTVALNLVIALGTGIINAIPVFLESLVSLIKTIIEAFENTDWASLGKTVVEGIKNGISRAWSSLKTWFNNLWNSLFNNRTVNVNVATGGAGSYANGLSYVPYDGFRAILHEGERVLTAEENSAYNKGVKGNTSGITIIQNIQTVPQTPVELAAATSAYFEQARWALA